jgi:hypothetical protein
MARLEQGVEVGARSATYEYGRITIVILVSAIGGLFSSARGSRVSRYLFLYNIFFGGKIVLICPIQVFMENITD